MAETQGNEILVGTGRPVGPGEAQPRAEHPAVAKVKEAISAWWERTGPGSVEKQWVAAHRNIIPHIKETGKRAAFEATADTWRRVGKALGIASTVVDFSLSGLGLVLMGKGLRNPLHTENTINGLIDKSKINWLVWLYYRVQMGKHANTQIKNIPSGHFDNRLHTLGVAESLVSGVGAAAIALGAGPAHITWSLAAKVAEFVGVAGAKVEDYIGSGKAEEHARAAGGVLDKGIAVAAKHPDIVPEKYRGSLQTIARVRQESAEAKSAEDTRRGIQEKEQLVREQKEWMDTMDPSLRSYYEQSGQWPPPREEFLKHRDGYQKDRKKAKADEKKAG